MKTAAKKLLKRMKRRHQKHLRKRLVYHATENLTHSFILKYTVPDILVVSEQEEEEEEAN